MLGLGVKDAEITRLKDSSFVGLLLRFPHLSTPLTGVSNQCRLLSVTTRIVDNYSIITLLS